MNKSITCPQCGMVSYHPKDIEQQYCGNCHEFHADIKAKAQAIANGKPSVITKVKKPRKKRAKKKGKK